MDFFRHKDWIKFCLVCYEFASRRQTATLLWQLFELPKMACQGFQLRSDCIAILGRLRSHRCR
jgi:hypothetical protein